MKDVTPKNAKCLPGGCPGIFEVTPQDMKCTIATSCPAIFEREDGYLIVGKKLPEVPADLQSRVGEDETVVWVPRGLVQPRE